MSEGSENVLVVSPGRFVAPMVVMTQATWHFDFDNGDDANDGLTETTPIKTWTRKPDGSLGEYVKRTGLEPFIDMPVEMFIKGDLPNTDLMAFFGTPGPRCQITVHGVPKVKRTGTITARQDRSPAYALIGDVFADFNIKSSTATSPIIIETQNPHGLVEWDKVVIRFHTVNTSANGCWPQIHVIDPTHFSLTGSVGTAPGGADGEIVVNRRDEIQDSAVADWTADVLQMIEVQTSATRLYQGNVVSGPTRGWIAKAGTNPPRACLSIMGSQVFTPTNRFQGEWPGPFPVGATYSILQLPKISGLYIDPRLAINFVNRLNPCTAELLDFPLDFANPNLSIPAFGGWLYFDCAADYLYMGYTGTPTCVNCLTRRGLSVFGGGTTVFGMLAPGSFASAQGVWFAYGMMLQGPGAMIFADGSQGSGNGFIMQNHHASLGLGIFDCDSPIYIGNNACLSNESNLYGTGITTCVMHIDQGGRVVDNNGYAVRRPYCMVEGPGTDIIMNNQSSQPAMDKLTHVLTNDRRLLNFINLFKKVSDGGFEGRVFDPDSPQTSYEFETPQPAPHLISINPVSSSHLGGASMTIVGWNFTGATNVQIGGVFVSSFTVVDDLTIRATIPALAVGAGYNVSVFGPGGVDTLTGVYTAT